MYAATQWTPLPTGHGPLGLASQKKGQVTPTVRTDTNHNPSTNDKKAHNRKIDCVLLGFILVKV